MHILALVMHSGFTLDFDFEVYSHSPFPKIPKKESAVMLQPYYVFQIHTLKSKELRYQVELTFTAYRPHYQRNRNCSRDLPIIHTRQRPIEDPSVSHGSFEVSQRPKSDNFIYWKNNPEPQFWENFIERARVYVQCRKDHLGEILFY